MGHLFGHGFVGPFHDWEWYTKAQKSRVGEGAGVAKDTTPLFVIFINVQISAVENVDHILSRNHRIANVFLNAAEIRVSKN